MNLLIQEHIKHPSSPVMFPSPMTGKIYGPDCLERQIEASHKVGHLMFAEDISANAKLAAAVGMNVEGPRLFVFDGWGPSYKFTAS